MLPPAKKVLLWIGSPGAMAAANTAMRLAAVTYCLGWPSTIFDGQDNGATTKDFVRRLPPMVARTASLYVVGRWGVGVSAVGGAKGGIVGAEASLSSLARILSLNAAQLPKTVIHGLDFGHDGVNASKEGCGVCFNSQRKIVIIFVVLVLGKRFH